MSSGSERRKRTKIVPVRVSQEEYAALSQRAEVSRRTVAAYLRTTGLGQSPRTRDTTALIAALSKIGNNVNQLAKKANQTGHVPAAEVLTAALDELRAVMERLA